MREHLFIEVVDLLFESLQDPEVTGDVPIEERSQERRRIKRAQAAVLADPVIEIAQELVIPWRVP